MHSFDYYEIVKQQKDQQTKELVFNQELVYMLNLSNMYIQHNQ